MKGEGGGVKYKAEAKEKDKIGRREHREEKNIPGVKITTIAPYNLR